MKRNIDDIFLQWKTKKGKSPLIIRGARQIGKSFSVEKFGRDNFKNVVVINFEASSHFAHCFEEDLNPKRIISTLEALVGQRIIPNQTLLFFDEIQHCARAILSLRYFKEKIPDLHVIGAGSLLEFSLDETNFSFPVGRVQFLHMYPLSFMEYLHASSNSMLADMFQEVSIRHPIDPVLHRTLLQHVKDYFFVGGMPEPVLDFIENHSFLECQRIQSSLLQTYQNDFAKYANKIQYQYLQRLFEKAPYLVSKHFKYSKVDPEAASRDVKHALDILCRIGILTKVYHTHANGLPLRAQINEKKFKILLVDVGLQQASMHILPSAEPQDLLSMHQGAIAEQFVGQELLAMSDPYFDTKLHFWEREKTSSSAEVDYVINVNGQIIPIEVKAGSTGKLRSLKQFMTEKKISIGLQISEAPLNFENGILTIPFYLINQIPRLLTSSSEKL